MSRKLIITEKPSVARDFARVLGVAGKANGYIENKDYVITWCVGHLVEMCYPEVYDVRYKTWKVEDLPFLPEKYLYSVIDNVKGQYEIVNRFLHSDDIDTVYWAGDSGKEGQTIEENIRRFGGVREGMTELRVWIDSQTDDEIKRGIREAKPMSDYDLLGRSGIMRSIEDYALGINFSRALSVKYGRMINDSAGTESYTAIAVGRVMTCVLGMVVIREREIRNFVETPFYRVVGNFSDIKFPAEWKAVDGSRYFESPLLYKENGFKKKESAEELISSLQGKVATIDQVEKGTQKKRAPLLFNLAELQAECSKIFKISPSETLQVAQELYEAKLTTYPRTDARVLTTAVAKEITKNLKGLSGLAEMAPYVKEILDGKKYVGLEKSPYTDDKKVTDHYAIIPTGVLTNIGNLKPLTRSVYDLIVKRFLAIFYPPAEYKTLKIQVRVDSELFFASASVLVNPGYMKVSGIPQKKDEEDEEEGGSFSKEDFLAFADKVQKGDEISVNGYDIKESSTNPPKRYTSGSLILAMENAGKLIEDEELREQIKKTGIGTSATRAEILEKLVRIKYLKQNNKTQIITPEPFGEMIYEVVRLSVPSLLNPEMTASWERGLEGIVNGTVDDAVYRKKLEDFIAQETLKMVASDLKADIATAIFNEIGVRMSGAKVKIGMSCPVCGGDLVTTTFGFGCSNYDIELKCGFAIGKIAGVDLTTEQVKELLTTGALPAMTGFVSKSGKKFAAALKYSLGEDNRPKIEFDFDSVPEEVVEGLICPACGGRIVKTMFGFQCENRRKEENPCYFAVSEIAEKKITEEQLRALLTDGTTEVIRGFKAKSKKLFDGKLKLVQNEEGRYVINFDFENIEPNKIEGVTCPDCGGAIIIRNGMYFCEHNDRENSESCKFAIFKIADKALNESQVKELLTEGKTKTIRGFKSKAGKKFDACLILKKDEETGKHSVSFDFENVEDRVLKDVVCPMCGGEIIKRYSGYFCKNYDREKEDACKFNIVKIASKPFNDAQVKELLQNGITSVIDGFVAKTGMKFSAKVALAKDESGKVTGTKFVFDDDDKEVPDLKCPVCGSKLLVNGYGYRCEKYTKNPDEGCKFRVNKVASRMLSAEELKELLEKHKTGVLSGFISKAGKEFSASLVMDEQFAISFDFEEANKASNGQNGNTESPKTNE